MASRPDQKIGKLNLRVPDLLPCHRPALFLAPMQDVTDLPFIKLMARYGGPDVFVTEYFRVHRDSRLEAHITESITSHGTGKPVIAQMIGQDIPSLIRCAKELQQLPVAGIDLNLGCPAPIVCRKDAGGGLLRQPAKIDAILGELRQVITTRFTVKCRVGYDSPAEFPALLKVFARHAIDILTVHARTVADGYRGPIKSECVRRAVETLSCPVIANGNVLDVESGMAYLKASSAAGLMCGRGAIRNPWLFSELRAHYENCAPPVPTGRDVIGYIQALWDDTAAYHQNYIPTKQVAKMKKYTAFIARGAAPEFDHDIRRAVTREEFFAICRAHFDHMDPAYQFRDTVTAGTFPKNGV